MVIGFSVVNLVYYFKIYNSETDTGVSKNNAMMMIILNIITIIASVILIIIMALRFPRSKEILSSNLGNTSSNLGNSSQKESCNSSCNSCIKCNKNFQEYRDLLNSPVIIDSPSVSSQTISSQSSSSSNLKKPLSNLEDIIFKPNNDNSITKGFLNLVPPTIMLNPGGITKNSLSDSDVRRIDNTIEGSKELLDFLNIKLNFFDDKLLLQWNENYSINYNNKIFKFNDTDMIGLNSKLKNSIVYRFLYYIDSILPDKNNLRILTMDDLHNNFENIDFGNLERLLFPFKFNSTFNDQWVLFAIDLENDIVVIEDPLFNESRRKTFVDYAKRITDLLELKIKSLNESEEKMWEINYTNSSSTKNINDTGVFVVWNTVKLMLKNIESDLSESIILNDNTVIWYRTVIAKTLLELEAKIL